MSDEPKLAAWQYYYKDNACPAEYSRSENCICWHNEGSGPFPELKNGDEVPPTYGSAIGLTWRRVPAPAVPDDVAELVERGRNFTYRRIGSELVYRMADALEAQAAELARLTDKLELERALTDGAHRRARAADAHTAEQPAPDAVAAPCPCICHTQKGITHVFACCDQPPFDPFAETTAVPNLAKGSRP